MCHYQTQFTRVKNKRDNSFNNNTESQLRGKILIYRIFSRSLTLQLVNRSLVLCQFLVDVVLRLVRYDLGGGRSVFVFFWIVVLRRRRRFQWYSHVFVLPNGGAEIGGRVRRNPPEVFRRCASCRSRRRLKRKETLLIHLLAFSRVRVVG